jgi:hypothetical protein
VSADAAPCAELFVHDAFQTNVDWKWGGVMKIPEALQIPAIVFTLQGAMLVGWILVFLIL